MLFRSLENLSIGWIQIDARSGPRSGPTPNSTLADIAGHLPRLRKLTLRDLYPIAYHTFLPNLLNETQGTLRELHIVPCPGQDLRTTANDLALHLPLALRLEVFTLNSVPRKTRYWFTVELDSLYAYLKQSSLRHLALPFPPSPALIHSLPTTLTFLDISGRKHSLETLEFL